MIGEDLLHIGDMELNSGGDLELATGRENILQAIFHRLITTKGSLLHRPDYGVGIKSFQGRVSSLGVQQEMALLIKEQLELDPRIDEVEKISINQGYDPSLFTIIIKVNVIGLGSVEDEFKPFEG